MKKILVLVYVFAVLLFAGLAKADEGTATISAVSYDADSYKMEINGYRLSSCQVMPVPTLVSANVPGGRNHFIVRVSTTLMNTFACAQEVKPYTISFDVRMLGLPLNRELTLLFENASRAVVPVSLEIAEDANGLEMGKFESAGTIIELPESLNFPVDNKYGFQTNEGFVFVLEDSMNFAAYLGQKVHITAMKLDHAVNPGLDIGVATFGITPNINGLTANLPDSLLVTSISAL